MSVLAPCPFEQAQRSRGSLRSNAPDHKSGVRLGAVKKIFIKKIFRIAPAKKTENKALEEQATRKLNKKHAARQGDSVVNNFLMNRVA